MSEDNGLSFQLDQKHVHVQAFALWTALGEAMKMLANTRGDDGWHRELYETIMQRFDTSTFRDHAGNKITRSENPELDAAARAASEIVERAFDRLK